MSATKTILVTGASSGFGALTARHLASAGHRVYASMRELRPALVDETKKYANENKVDLRAIECNVVEDSSCKNAIDQILKESGKLDVVIHNAGHMCYGPAESFAPEQYQTYYDINALGPQRVNRAILPHWRKDGRGLLLWVGSTSTRGGTPPFLAPYFAAKAAMDSLAVSYSTELSRFGIETTIVVPGAFTGGTNHFANAGQPTDKDVESAYFGEGEKYEGMSEKIFKALAALEPEGADVGEVAKEIVRVVGLKHGTRPFRVHIDPSDDGATVVNGVADLARKDFYRRMGQEDLLTPA